MSDDLLRMLGIPRSPIAPERVRILLASARPILDQARELVRAGKKRGEISMKPPCSAKELAEAEAEGERLSALEYVHRCRDKKRRMNRKEE